MDLLNVVKREITGKKVEGLRGEGLIPAVMYGADTDNINLAVNYQIFEKLYKKSGESTLLNLKVEGVDEEITVLIHDVFYHHVTNRISHIDFYKIDYKKKLNAHVELVFIGEPKSVKELGGILMTELDAVEIECLPKDLIASIQVDLSVLTTFDDIIQVSDLKVPASVKILTGAGDLVAKVAPPRVVEEKVAEAVAPVEEKKVEKKSDDKK